jgi:hypothetical protein
VFFRDIAILQQPLLALPIATSVGLSVYFWLLELSGQYTVYSILSSGVVPAISAWVDTTVDFDVGQVWLEFSETTLKGFYEIWE